eukprot:7777496-Pyramimonas_sp.AAC.1
MAEEALKTAPRACPDEGPEEEEEEEEEQEEASCHGPRRSSKEHRNAPRGERLRRATKEDTRL